MSTAKKENWSERRMELDCKIRSIEELVYQKTGLNLEQFKVVTKNYPIEKYFKEPIYFIELYTDGIRCLILTSTLYPEVGILVFDGNDVGAGTSVSGAENVSFSTVCGCCSPNFAGIRRKERISDKGELRTKFILAIKDACQRGGIKILILHWFKSLVGKNEIKLDNQQIISSGYNENGRLRKDIIDKWRFAVAFRQLTFGGSVKFPFDKLNWQISV